MNGNRVRSYDLESGKLIWECGGQVENAIPSPILLDNNYVICMTGYRGNGKATDFITSVNGTVLIKPFHVDDLLELFAFVELRTHLLAA